MWGIQVESDFATMLNYYHFGIKFFLLVAWAFKLKADSFIYI